MKGLQLLFVFLVSLLISSCTSYQHVTLESDLPIEEDTKRYYTSKDGIKISYDFSDLNMSIRTRIYNESDSDLFVDLQSSLYILNGKIEGIAYRGQEVDLRTRSTHYEGDPDVLWDNSTTYTSGKGSITGKPGVIYIPPGTYMQIWGRPYKVRYDEDKKINYTEKIVLKDDHISRKVKRYDFSDDAKKFTVSFRVSKEPDFSEAKNIVASFKEGTLYSYTSRLDNVPDGESKSYVTKITKGGTVGGIFLLLGIGLLLAALGAEGDSAE